jgi:predicted nucleic acid-binding protein
VIVLDASALIELLVGTAAGRRIARRLGDPRVSLHIPQLAYIEVLQVLRRYVASREITPADADAAIEDLQALDLEPHDHEPFLDRVWDLRDNFSAYDAVYVALAQALGAVILTCDRKLASAPAARGFVELA